MQQPESPSVVRASAQISALTLVSRIAGFVRWVMLGYAVGTTYLGNVYQTANLVPNVIFELVAGGLLSSVLVPTFVRERDHDRISEIASSLCNALLLVSIPLVVIGVVLARPLMSALLVGVTDPVIKQQQVELGAWFLRFFLPQVPLYLLGIVMQGILHAHRRFVIPALAPLLSSLTVIATYIVFRQMGSDVSLGAVRREQLWVLAVGTTLGVLVLTFCQLPAVLRTGVRWRRTLSLRDPVVRGALRAGGWGAGFLGVTQLMFVVAVMLANRVEGGVVAFQIANAFFELPNAVIGLPVAISLFPALSEAYAERDERTFARLVSHGWRLVLFGAVPAAVALYLLAPAASDVLLGWADDVDPRLVAATVQGLAVGIPAWLVIATIVRGLYARGATARPFVVNAVAFVTLLVAGVGATAVLTPEGSDALRVLGSAIGAGWWLAAITGVVLLSRLARRWDVAEAGRALGANVMRATAVGAVVWAVLRVLREGVVELVVAGVAGAVVFVILALSSRDLRSSLAFLGRRRTRSDPAGARRVTHVLWRSRGGIRRHVRTIAEHPPEGWTTDAIRGPADLAPYFAGLPFEPLSLIGLLRPPRDVDLIHAHGITAGLVGLVPRRPPVVLSIHVVIGKSGRSRRAGVGPMLARFIARRADAIVAVSGEAAAGFRDVHVVPPAFGALPSAERDRREVREDLGVSADDVVVICVARLEDTKRLDLVISAVEVAGCVGWIVGDGPYRERLESLATGSRTKLLGHRDDVADLLGAADLFALPSESESYGIAVAEAVAAGLPVVATSTGAIGELVGSGGIVVPPGDEDAFVGAVTTLVHDADARERRARAVRSIVLPDAASLTAELGRVYDEAVGDQREGS